ncbi:hypothetical protein WG66_007027 [Moniliophthora roreri]|nr:hypothetical protein WG66_007027 [Moniliophthora roreri]
MVSETCNAALQSISDRSLSSDKVDLPPLAIIHKDFTSLLSLIYSSTTKLALVMNPSSPTYPATVTPLNDLSKHISAVSYCSKLVDPNEHGATISQEIADVASSVTDALNSLVKTFLETEALGEHAGSGDYMVKTGSVHDLIEAARSSNGLSKDNLSAVRKKWTEDTEPLEDGTRELKELIESAGDEGFGDEDDGWDELGLGGTEPLSSEEAERASKASLFSEGYCNIHLILRLVALLHKKVASDLLVRSTDVLTPSHSSLDELPALSRAILSASDEVIAALHPPQDQPVLKHELDAYRQVLQDLKKCVYQFLPEEAVEDQIERLTFKNGSGSRGKKTSKRRWFDSCFEQIFKGLDNGSSVLSDSEA